MHSRSGTPRVRCAAREVDRTVEEMRSRHEHHAGADGDQMRHGNDLESSHGRADDAGEQSGAKWLRERIVAERRQPAPQQGAGAGAERNNAKRKPFRHRR